MSRAQQSNRFALSPQIGVNRSAFPIRQKHLTTIDMDYFIPIYVEETLPGDTFNVDLSMYVRQTSSLVTPLMDNVKFDVLWFWCPTRIVWTNFVKQMGEQENPGDSTDYTTPILSLSSQTFDHGTIHDYLGMPTQGTHTDTKISAIPYRVYNRIWNDHLRDQNLHNSIANNTGDGPDNVGDYSLRKSCKIHDYFCSCLPSPQKGDAVELPLGTTAPVIGNGTSLGVTDTFNTAGLQHDSMVAATLTNQDSSGSPVGTYDGSPNPLAAGYSLGLSTNPLLSGAIADLSSATAATINSLREAEVLQKMLEADMRSGTRYPESVMVHFHVTVPDFRAQRSVYLGSSSFELINHVVANTSFSEEGGVASHQPGELVSYNTAGRQGMGFKQSFVEHGHVMGLIRARADLTYQQGLRRMWSRQTRFDHAFPLMANLGEQPVYSREIYCTGDSADDNVFGYQERYAEYKYGHSLVTGLFRSDATGSLDTYHLAQWFTSRPTLNYTFIQSDTDMDRCVSVPTQPHFIIEAQFNNVYVRPLPAYAKPGLGSNF